jgi:hypothetical protein
VTFQIEFVPEKKATPRIPGYSAKKKKKIMFGLAHFPAIKSHTVSNPLDTDSIKKRTDVHMGSSGKNPLKHLFGTNITGYIRF